jgi:demethylmenaquinone methyltransferase/2-methoxy-6-polyprenyl-1,4-benzoquinol methylase
LIAPSLQLAAGTLPSPRSAAGENAKARFIRRMFDTIAPDYDRLNTWVSFGMDRFWRRRTVRAMPRDGWIADWCAGTGALARTYLRRRGTSGRVVMCDFSAEMCRLSGNMFTPAERPRVFYVCCDVTKPPFRDGVFDGQMMGFSIRNLTCRTAFFAEARRCAASSGCGALLDLSSPRFRPWRWLCRFHFNMAAPLIVKLVARRGMYAYRYLSESIFHQADPQQITDEIRAAGFPDARFRSLAGGVGVIFRWGPRPGKTR